MTLGLGDPGKQGTCTLSSSGGSTSVAVKLRANDLEDVWT